VIGLSIATFTVQRQCIETGFVFTQDVTSEMREVHLQSSYIHTAGVHQFLLHLA